MNLNWLKELMDYGLKGPEEIKELKQKTIKLIPLRREIKDLTQTIANLQVKLKNEGELAKENEKTYLDTLSKLNALKSPQIESYYFKKISQKYRWKPDKYTLLRYSLANFSKDSEYLSKYISFLQTNGLKESYKDLDSLVYSVIRIAYNYLDSLPNDYKTDIKSFGAKEYWLTPQEAFDYYVTNEKAGDCEDFSNLLYGALVSALLLFGYSEETWRIKRVDIKRPTSHAIVIYLNNRGEWKRIESTYFRREFARKWNDSSDIFKGPYTIVWHCFDESSEYKFKS